MNETKEGRYLDTYSKTLKTNKPQWIKVFQKKGIEQFKQIGFPTTKVEGWRKTNIRPVSCGEFTLSERDPELAERKPMFKDLEDTYRIFMHNGACNERFSNLKDFPKEVELVDSNKDISPQIQNKIGLLSHLSANPFTALNAALFRSAPIIVIKENAVLKKPIHLEQYTASVEPSFQTHPRVIVVAGKNSSFTVIETYTGNPSGSYFLNAVVEIFLDEQAQVEHIKIQNDNQSSNHFSGTYFYQSADSHLTTHSITFGSALSRNDITVKLDGPGAECQLFGLYLGFSKQIMDTHSKIIHSKDHTKSNELYKGVMSDKSRGVFNGLVKVEPYACKSEAFQKNAVLLLSNNAVADSEPHLEINNDDIKCSHGATIGQLNTDQLFYLQSRGLSERIAKAVMTTAFAKEAIQNIPNSLLLKELNKIILQKYSEL